MAHIMTVTLDDSLAQVIDRMVASGRYDSVGEAVEASLRLIMERDALRSALIEGEAGGSFEDFDTGEFLASVRHPPPAQETGTAGNISLQPTTSS